MPTKATGIHAHHIVYKEGNGAAGIAAANEAKDILLYYGINPYWDRENLAYGGNPGAHPASFIVNLDTQLRNELGSKNRKSEIITILKNAADLLLITYG